MLKYLKDNQDKIAIVIGYFLVASLFFALGKYTIYPKQHTVEIVEPPLNLTQIYHNLNPEASQSVAGASIDGEFVKNCKGKIKGNPSSKIFHVPGGAFYDRLSSPVCFESENAAQAAGYRKSQR